MWIQERGKYTRLCERYKGSLTNKPKIASIGLKDKRKKLSKKQA